MLILFLDCSKGLNSGFIETGVGCTGIDAVWDMLEIGETYCGDVGGDDGSDSGDWGVGIMGNVPVAHGARRVRHVL